MLTLLYAAYALIHVALFAWGIRLYLRSRNPATLPVILVAGGLIYDNLIIALGRFIGESRALEVLSVPRFVLHAALTPLLILSALGLARRAKINWASKTEVGIGALIVTIAMIGYGIVSDVVRLELEAQSAGGTLSYGNANTLPIPLPPFVTVLAVLIAGWAIWRRSKWPWLLAAGVVMLIAGAIGPSLEGVANLGEVALVAGFLMTDTDITRNESRIAPNRPPEKTAPHPLHSIR